MARWRKAAALIAACLMLAGAAGSAHAQAAREPVHRTAIVSAFEPEWQTLKASAENRQEQVIAGTTFVTGSIAGKPVVLFLSGISMVNAAMTTQLALDHFTIDRLVFSGIAGGVDPALSIGDVVVPASWSQYLEAVFAREVEGGGFKLPPFAEQTASNFGMIFPQPVLIARGSAKPEKVTWFEADAVLLALAKGIETTSLMQCTAAKACLRRQPRVVVGGRGVSGQAFIDNKAFREYIGTAFTAASVDMETAALAHVAYANKVPFIAFRSLSDLAGGGDGENEIGTFLQLASENSAVVVMAFLKALP